jgi:hypothetical protein
MMPEAILERITFISESSITDALRGLLAVKGQLPPDLTLAIKDYVRICQLRHCAVHRFGKLGVSNAISLGLAEHNALLEKPLKLDYTALQNAIGISTGFVKTINNFLFNEILSRVPSQNWTGTYARDRSLFMKYYALFADKVSVIKTAQPNILYKQLKKQHAMFAAGVEY